VWVAPSKWGRFYEVFSVTTGIALLAIGVRTLALRSGKGADFLHPNGSVVPATLAALLLAAGVLYALDFPCRPQYVARWLEFGFPPELACSESISGNKTLAQALEPLRFVTVAAGLGVLAWGTAAASGGWVALTAAGLLVTLSPVLVIARGFLAPSDEYSVAEDPGLYVVLGSVPVRGSLLVASDLADPAQNFRRPLQGMLLTGYRGHAFYVANLRYVQFTRPDAPVRLAELQSFFGAPWTPWHSAWLAEKHITHILVSDRCLPPWADQAGLPFSEVARSGRWTAYAVGTLDPAPSAGRPAAGGLPPAYGVADCLSARKHPGPEAPPGGGQHSNHASSG
jgi:hypothetical protein